jgi:hypothetical protein
MEFKDHKCVYPILDALNAESHKRQPTINPWINDKLTVHDRDSYNYSGIFNDQFDWFSCIFNLIGHVCCHSIPFHLQIDNTH